MQDLMALNSVELKIEWLKLKKNLFGTIVLLNLILFYIVLSIGVVWEQSFFAQKAKSHIPHFSMQNYHAIHWYIFLYVVLQAENLIKTETVKAEIKFISNALHIYYLLW